MQREKEVRECLGLGIGEGLVQGQDGSSGLSGNVLQGRIFKPRRVRAGEPSLESPGRDSACLRVGSPEDARLGHQEGAGASGGSWESF